jgi:hypothetical protein
MHYILDIRLNAQYSMVVYWAQNTGRRRVRFPRRAGDLLLWPNDHLRELDERNNCFIG